MEWTEDLIKNIVANIGANNIVPVIGPNVFYVENEERMTVQQYVVQELLNNHLKDEATEQNIHSCSNGLKGMSRLFKLFKKHNKSLNQSIYSLYFNKDTKFLSQIKMDNEVQAFLQLGQFPLILTTVNYCILEESLLFHGRKYESVSYRKQKVKNKKEEDIILKEDKREIEFPSIFHLLGTISVSPETGVVTEDDFLKFLHCLHDTNTRPENLHEYLKFENKKYLLTLGCDIPDWTFRFLLHSLKADEYGGLHDNDAADDYFVGGAIDEQLNEDVTEFLMDIGYFPNKKIKAFLNDINSYLSPEEKPKVFLSLCSEEYDSYGNKLYQALSDRFEVWFYKNDGDQYRYWNDPEHGIENGLKTSDYILPVITPNAIDRIDDYIVPEMPNDDTSGLIEEWTRAKKYGIKCCPLYIGRNEIHLKKALKRNTACESLLWSFFFSEDGNAGIHVDPETFSSETLYKLLKNHLNEA